MSDGTETMQKLAGCVMALRESRHTVLQLSGRTGAHRRTVSKWLQTLERAGQVKPHGTGASGRFGNGCAVLWEWVEKPAEAAPSTGRVTVPAQFERRVPSVFHLGAML